MQSLPQPESGQAYGELILGAPQGEQQLSGVPSLLTATCIRLRTQQQIGAGFSWQEIGDACIHAEADGGCTRQPAADGCNLQQDSCDSQPVQHDLQINR